MIDNEMKLAHTVNSTTTTKGNCSATVIAQTENPYTGVIVTTFELVYPRFIHAEFMTHRMFSRNASSSRAIPIERLIDEATVTPVHWTKNEKGMVGKESFTPAEIECLKGQWEGAREKAIATAKNMSYLNVHKQVANRLLEPFSFIKVVCTATDWENFFKLRLAPDVEPHMNDLACAMRVAGAGSTPKVATRHMPYCDDLSADFENPWAISAARCARVSYNSHNGTKATTEADIKLYNSLREHGHMTPLEHFCFAYDDKRYYANLNTWASHRYCIEHKLMGVKNGS